MYDSPFIHINKITDITFSKVTDDRRQLARENKRSWLLVSHIIKLLFIIKESSLIYFFEIKITFPRLILNL